MRSGTWARTSVLIITFIFTATYVCTVLLHEVDTINVGYWLLLFVFGYVLSIVLCSIIHELGHVTFGLLSGYALDSISVLGYAFIKCGDTYVIKKMQIPGTLGATLMHPFNENNGRYALYIMGGSIFTLVVAILFSVVGFLVTSSSISALFHALALGGYTLTIFNVLPIGQKGLYNDGLLLKLIKQDKRTLTLFNRFEIMSRMTLQGISIKDMSEDIFNIPESYYSVPLANELRMNKAEFLIHNERFVEAEAELTNILEATKDDADTLHDTAVCLLLMSYLHTDSNLEKIKDLYTKYENNIAILSRYYLTAKCVLIACKMQLINDLDLDRDIEEFYALAKGQYADCTFEYKFMKNILLRNEMDNHICD